MGSSRLGRGGGVQAGKAGNVAAPDLCARRYQRPLHLAVSKPLQKNNKLWALFDRHLLAKGKRDNKCMPGGNRGEAVEVGGTQNRQGKQGKQVPTFGKEATLTQTPPPPSLRDGGKNQKQEIPH